MSKFQNLDQALEDVEARFLYCLPESELNSSSRIFFQLEQAWWFYEDFMSDVNPILPHFPYLKGFAEKIFSHCPLLSHFKIDKFAELFSNFSSYKSQIPVCGCIMLNPEMTKALLVCNWSGKSWGFPKGKINENEEPVHCAVREAFEECGYDATDNCCEEDQLVHVEENKTTKLFIATNVLESTVFCPQTRKEISEAAFFHLDEFPKATYSVHPFMPKLRRWISIKLKEKEQQALRDRGNRKDKRGKGAVSGVTPAIPLANTQSPKRVVKESLSFNNRNADTFSEEVTGGSKGWGVSDMFKANARLTGLRYEYDGNPHSFGAYHPQYVNYTQKEKEEKEEKENGEVSGVSGVGTTSSASSSLVYTNNTGNNDYEYIGGAEAEAPSSSLINGRDIFNVPILSNPPSGTKRRTRRKKVKDEVTPSDALPAPSDSPRFPHPFIFNKDDIFSAIDSVLRDTANIAFEY